MLLPEQVSGFEVFVDNLDDLDPLGVFVETDVLVGLPYYSNTIKQLEPTIFDWLNLTDVNERIILIIMILVAIINMTTSLLILILERTNMIGTLKALGATNWAVRKIFLYYAAYIIGWGLFWGNVLGIGLGVLQKTFGIIKLPEDLYYVSVAPIELNIPLVIALNIGTLIITLLVLVLPSYLVSRIDPVKAIRFK
jgi:lipoprotein-releasing system permease protein